MVTNDKGVFYRVTCVGRSTRSNQPRVLFLEFNEHAVFIKELSWPMNAGLGLVSSYSFVGSCSFSAPHLVGGSTQDISDEIRFMKEPI